MHGHITKSSIIRYSCKDKTWLHNGICKCIFSCIYVPYACYRLYVFLSTPYPLGLDCYFKVPKTLFPRNLKIKKAVFIQELSLCCNFSAYVDRVYEFQGVSVVGRRKISGCIGVSVNVSNCWPLISLVEKIAVAFSFFFFFLLWCQLYQALFLCRWGTTGRKSGSNVYYTSMSVCIALSLPDYWHVLFPGYWRQSVQSCTKW